MTADSKDNGDVTMLPETSDASRTTVKIRVATDTIPFNVTAEDVENSFTTASILPGGKTTTDVATASPVPSWLSGSSKASVPETSTANSDAAQLTETNTELSSDATEQPTEPTEQQAETTDQPTVDHPTESRAISTKTAVQPSETTEQHTETTELPSAINDIEQQSANISKGTLTKH